MKSNLVDLQINPKMGFGLLDKENVIEDILPPRINPFEQSDFVSFFTILTPDLDLAPGSCTEFTLEKKIRTVFY
jgi:hypothetical protein